MGMHRGKTFFKPDVIQSFPYIYNHSAASSIAPLSETDQSTAASIQSNCSDIQKT